MPNRLLPPRHSVSERSRYFSVTISRIGPTSCAMPPCTSTRLSCSRSACAAETSSGREDAVVGQQAAAADARTPDRPRPAHTPWISLMPGQTPPESCQPPPEPPSHSPRMARAATRRRSVFLQAACRARVPGSWRACRPRSAHASRLVETASREPFGNVVDLADDLDAAPGSRSARASRSLSGWLAPSMPGGTMPEAITAAFSSPR